MEEEPKTITNRPSQHSFDAPSFDLSPFEPGTVIAERYELRSILGSGGSAFVYRAYDRMIEGDLVALKVIYPSALQSAAASKRLYNEVRIARSLSHPHIVQIYDFGDAGNGYFSMAMELIPGENLLSYVATQPDQRLSLAETLTIIFQLTVALDHAHRRGVVHRDLKPSNVLLDEQGFAKLSDFGAARSMHVDPKITPTGELIGTPHYMAPELMRGETADARADIYALGILAYQLLIGELPFDDPSILRIVAMQLNHPIPDTRQIRPDLPTWFQDFIEVCCEKSAGMRFQSAAEVSSEIWMQMGRLGVDPRMLTLPPHFAAEFSAGSRTLVTRMLRAVSRARTPGSSAPSTRRN